MLEIWLQPCPTRDEGDGGGGSRGFPRGAGATVAASFWEGNRQGAEENQDESRALEGTFPREGALKGKPDNPGRLHELHNKQTGLW